MAHAAPSWLLAIWFGALGCRGSESTPAAPVATDRPAVVESSAPSISDDPVVRALLELAVDSEVDDHLRVLAVDIGPRLSGSSNLEEAEEWAVAEFERWGLTAKLEPWGEFPVGFERGPASGAMIRPERKELEFGTWAWTPGTPGGSPRRGQALGYPTSRAELKDVLPRLRDAWIVLPHGFRPRPKKNDLDGRAEREFERHGIAGFVRAAGGPDEQRISFHGDYRVQWKDLPDRVDIRLRGDQHAELSKLLAAGEFVQLEFAIAQEFVEGPIVLNNVIAELAGEDPSQAVIVGGHLDSWDGASGAIDNATGVAVTMEAARLLALACSEAGVKPARSIQFHLWTGEEQGLLGSVAWVADHPDDLAGIAAVLVHDGGTNYVSGLPVTPEMFVDMQAVFAPVDALVAQSKAATEPFSFRLDLAEALPFEPSDSTPFLREGVPAFYWAQSGRSDYQIYHHTQLDQPDAVIDDYQRHSALVVAIAAWNLATLDHPLDRRNIIPLEPRRLGVVIEDGAVSEIAADGLAKSAGIRVGDRVVEIDGVAIADDGAIGPALSPGASTKRVTIEREGDRIDLQLDWTGQPDEAERMRRRSQRREAFPIELRPWDG